ALRFRMDQITSTDPKYLKDDWSQLPKWTLYVSTLPSALVWLGVILKVAGPILAIVMILFSGIPTKLVYQIYQRTCILNQKAPSVVGHVVFFFAQCFIYSLVFIYVLQP
ncbi:hypothetical protein, partial [Marinobacter halodurans]|uniref:hypothetical protein n=1 Tax=Marinobacter halodurans TaxID=2528979 RepID=UPI001A955357